ncbi:hypothetical protein [Lacticigenium naphthae]|uniref:hypothetical protein n=1 Tax=Lacticigenium naphthae TaxID=515351 RepID=UPI000425447A|nr:hypothetical protein [Lacticigenium naphthae]
MGLFDFLKKKNEFKVTIDPTEGSNEIAYFTDFRASSVTDDRSTIEQIVNKIIAEDPFKLFYGSHSETGTTHSPKLLFKYQEITTMAVTFDFEKVSHLPIYIEGILLGNVPSEIERDLREWQVKKELTSYVYITGGPYRVMDEENGRIVDREEALDLTIYVQYN